jgi:hypothetical protein
VAGEQAIYKTLVASAAVTNIIATRVYGGGVAPRDAALPYATYQVVSDHDRQLSISGATGLVAKRIQLNCNTTAYTQTVDLAAATRKALHGFSGSAGTENVYEIEMENEVDVTVPEVEGADRYVYSKIQDFIVWLDEATS